MEIEAACFTRRGQMTGERLAKALREGGLYLNLCRCGGEGPTAAAWTARHFSSADALLFIGAAGIAVRSAAPFITSKTSDPAVIVLDESARYVIPLLSGHIGGANALAAQMAAALGAAPVITTATDINGVFAFDTWAVCHGYHIQNPGQIKRVSAGLLAGGSITFSSEFPLEGALPCGVAPAAGKGQSDVCITVYDLPDMADALRLTPPALVLGAGCRKGVAQQAFEEAFDELCVRENLCAAAFGLVCSIDLKREEPGLLAFCERHGWPFRTFSAGELACLPGQYSASPFVCEATGVDNVCERSAVRGSAGRLIVKKRAMNGVTLAVAVKKWTVRV